MKKYFPIPYNTVLAATSIFVIYKFITDDFALAWFGAGLAIMPMLGFFLYVGSGATARTSRHLPLQLILAVLGVLLTIIDFNSLALAMAQRYREIESLGTDIFIISSQSERQSQKLAARFDVNLNFLVDDNNRVAKTLGIDHMDGVPAGIPGRGNAYAADTAMPTVIITDQQNTVVFASQTDNYRIHPEPDEFIRVLQGIERSPSKG